MMICEIPNQVGNYQISKSKYNKWEKKKKKYTSLSTIWLKPNEQYT